jgi:hypothetical protein
MTEQTKNNSATPAGHCAKPSKEAKKLLIEYATETAIGPTHFWCRYSNSIESIPFILQAWLA